MSVAARTSTDEASRLQAFVVNSLTLETFHSASEACLMLVSEEEPRIQVAQEVAVHDVSAEAEEDGEDPLLLERMLHHYSRRLDRRLIHPLLAAESRDAAAACLQQRWVWFVKTTQSMTALLAEHGVEAVIDTARCHEELIEGAKLAGDKTGEEAAFILSTMNAARSLARSITNEAPKELQAEDAAAAYAFAHNQYLFSLGGILLRASRHAQVVSDAGKAWAMELARTGALHSYAYARQALEFRRAPEPDYEPIAMSADEYQLAMSN